MRRLSNVLVFCGALLTIAGCSESPVGDAGESTAAQTTSTPALPQEPLKTQSPVNDAPDVADPTPSSEASPKGGQTVIRSADGAYTVAYTIDPDPIPLNELFGLHVEVTDVHGEPIDTAKVSLEVDARMPQHRHGMKTIANVSLNDDGAFTVSEMLFHMPGFWELYFDITDGAVTERAQAEIDIE